MSFASPLYLLGLLLVPFAAAAWIARRQRVRRYAIRFPAVSSAALAVGRVPAWRPFVPMTLLLASLAALVVAMAKPEHTVAVPIEKATIMLVTDHSRSMESDDVQPDRLAAAQKAANTFLNQVPGKVQVGVVAYSTAPDAVQTPTTDRDPVRQIINAQFPDGATATGDALQTALEAIKQSNGSGKATKKPPSAIVLLSDGKTTTGRDPVGVAVAAGQAKVPIYTVALGTEDGVVTGPGFGGYIPVPPDPETLGAIAQESGGKAFTAEDSGRLSDIYKNLGSRLGSKKQKKESVVPFVVGGLVLLLGAAATSTRFAPALP
ncbi:MAG TPA: VWA domain-containing protein [Thermoleophilaceae bacterium]|nr:VWA domain-containing protein [Thermoleophilaceae bacterium]